MPVWLPYLQSIRESKRGVFDFVFNGGEESIPADEIQSIMVYGEADTALDTRILTKICSRGIPIIIHRRNVERSIIITSGPRADHDDTLSAHLLKRAQSRTCTHVARQLLKAKMRSMTYLLTAADLPGNASVDKLRNIEAVHAKAYWDAWFRRLGHSEWHRRSKNPASETLDAVSKFVAGITLRWITYHNLSPFHGFLHTPTDYPTLVYDLMEPYRGLTDYIVLETMLRTADETKWTPHCIAAIKGWLSTKTYVPLTRQIVTNHELMHGAVLSLKFYLLGRQRIYHIPLPGKPQGGRPAKVEFKLYGRHAGRTDFWAEAGRVSQTADIGSLIAIEPAPWPPASTGTDNSEIEGTQAGPMTTVEGAGTSIPVPDVSLLTATTVRQDFSPSQTSRLPTARPDSTTAKPVSLTKVVTGRPMRPTPTLPCDYCIIDVETTGVVPSHDVLIELGALRVRSHRPSESFSCLISTDSPVNETIRSMTGLSSEQLKAEGVPLATALTDLLNFIGADTVIGYNVGFDVRFINQALFNLGSDPLVNPTVDIARVARKLLPGRDNYKLSNLATDLGVAGPISHRALADCETTARLIGVLYGHDSSKRHSREKIN
jgi:DNA polymerase III epsilon subunit-like protein/CRISPR/Cas system-associated endonuclease Cas1